MAESWMQQVIERIAQDINDAVPRIASEIGEMVDAPTVSPDDAYKSWAWRDPAVPVDQVRQAVSAGSLSVEEATWMLYPYRRDVLVTGHPRVKDRLAVARAMRGREAREGSAR